MSHDDLRAEQQADSAISEVVQQLNTGEKVPQGQRGAARVALTATRVEPAGIGR